MKRVAVVKVGGALLENPAAAVAKILAVECEALVVVHGGGLQITRMLQRMDVRSEFIDGLRVTDEATLQVVADALLGEVHTAVVAALRRTGRDALGIFGAVSAEKKAGPWGLVGTAVRANGSLLRHLIDVGSIPVIPTLAIGASSLLNVNGDETAAAVALALEADRLIFLTDVAGVLDANGSLIPRVARDVSLVDAPFVSGGMKPKLRAVETALAGGVSIVLVGHTVFGRTE